MAIVIYKNKHTFEQTWNNLHNEKILLLANVHFTKATLITDSEFVIKINLLLGMGSIPRHGAWHTSTGSLGRGQSPHCRKEALTPKMLVDRDQPD